jgi:hypothetical protein
VDWARTSPRSFRACFSARAVGELRLSRSEFSPLGVCGPPFGGPSHVWGSVSCKIAAADSTVPAACIGCRVSSTCFLPNVVTVDSPVLGAQYLQPPAYRRTSLFQKGILRRRRQRPRQLDQNAQFLAGKIDVERFFRKVDSTVHRDRTMRFLRHNPADITAHLDSTRSA